AGDIKKINSVRDLLVAVERLKVDYNTQTKVDDFVKDHATAEELFKLGLGKEASTLRIEAESRTGGELGGTEKEKPPLADDILIGNAVNDKKEKYYARLASEDNIVKVSATNITPILELLKNPEILRGKDLVQLDENKTDAINVQTPSGALVKLRKVGDWKLY